VGYIHGLLIKFREFWSFRPSAKEASGKSAKGLGIENNYGKNEYARRVAY